MPDAAPTIHVPTTDQDVSSLVEQLTAPDRERDGTGLHVVVAVTADGNTAYGRVNDADSPGHGSQRWVQHARRGSSPGGWSEQHHPRSEQHVGYWKDAAAASIDRVLIDHSKQAWKLDATAPYVVEFAPVELPQPGS
jgi:hypothetical protein